MASRILLSTLVAISCIILSFYMQPSSAAAIPDFFEGPADTDNDPTTAPKEDSSATTVDSLPDFISIHDNGDSSVTTAVMVDGFHLKLDGDTAVGVEATANLGWFSLSHGNDGELFLGQESGFDNINGVFRPSNGLYLLSCLAHVALKPEEEVSSSSTAESRVTVTICINGNCGNSAILKSSTVLPSSGAVQTVLVSGVLSLKQGQTVSVQVNNHSKDRQVTVSSQSTLTAHLLK